MLLFDKKNDAFVFLYNVLFIECLLLITAGSNLLVIECRFEIQIAFNVNYF